MQLRCCQCHKKIVVSSLAIHSKVLNRDNWKMSKIASVFMFGSIFTRVLLSEISAAGKELMVPQRGRKELVSLPCAL